MWRAFTADTGWYVAAAEKTGEPVRMPTMEGAGHFDEINPQAPAWETVMASVRSLLRVP